LRAVRRSFVLILLFSASMMSIDVYADDPLADMNLTIDDLSTSPWQANAYLESRYQFFAKDQQRLSARQRLWTEWQYQNIIDNEQQFFSVLSVFTDYDPAIKSYDNALEIRLHEAYLYYKKNEWQFTLGKKRITWGELHPNFRTDS